MDATCGHSHEFARRAVDRLEYSLARLRQAREIVERVRAQAVPLADQTDWRSPAGQAFHVRSAQVIGQMGESVAAIDDAIAECSRALARAESESYGC